MLGEGLRDSAGQAFASLQSPLDRCETPRSRELTNWRGTRGPERAVRLPSRESFTCSAGRTGTATRAHGSDTTRVCRVPAPCAGVSSSSGRGYSSSGTPASPSPVFPPLGSQRSQLIPPPRRWVSEPCWESTGPGKHAPRLLPGQLQPAALCPGTCPGQWSECLTDKVALSSSPPPSEAENLPPVAENSGLRWPSAGSGADHGANLLPRPN